MYFTTFLLGYQDLSRKPIRFIKSFRLKL